MQKRFEKYFEAVQYLENLPSINNGCFAPAQNPNPQHYLKRTRWLLNQLGDPDRKFKFIHVTGTSGKGSTATMLASVLKVAGRQVGLFTSPFATTSIEKIAVNGKYIQPKDFVLIVERIRPLIAKSVRECPWGRPTYFEVFLVMAFLYFQQRKCEWVVLEVGCGGRYDATNVIEKKELALITNIGMDHAHIIGDSLEEIAWEKAGIIKEGCQFFTSEKKPEMLKIFKQICQSQKVSMQKVVTKTRKIAWLNGKMEVWLDSFSGKIKSRLRGDHQIRNIALVAAAAKFLQISPRHIRRGISQVNLPCRFETVQKNPQVILDGAHNVDKIKSTVANLKKINYEKLILVLGLGEKKETEKIIQKIIPLANQIIGTTLNFGQSLSEEKMRLSVKKYAKKETGFEFEKNSSQALEKAFESAGKNDLILVTGSFYLAGELRKKWISEKRILKRRRSF